LSVTSLRFAKLICSHAASAYKPGYQIAPDLDTFVTHNRRMPHTAPASAAVTPRYRTLPLLRRAGGPLWSSAKWSIDAAARGW
jgi:hypothetical protein